MIAGNVRTPVETWTARAREGYALNLMGSMFTPMRRAINVSFPNQGWPTDGDVDFMALGEDLPEFQHVVLNRVLGLYPTELLPRIIQQARDRLTPDGRLWVLETDCRRLMRRYGAGVLSVEMLNETLFSRRGMMTGMSVWDEQGAVDLLERNDLSVVTRMHESAFPFGDLHEDLLLLLTARYQRPVAVAADLPGS